MDGTGKKILIATPIIDYKKYSIDAYLKAIKDLNWDNYSLLLVDNSKNLDFYEELENKIKEYGINGRAIHVEYSDDEFIRFGRAREEIRKWCLRDNYDYWFSVEADNIILPDTLERMFYYMRDCSAVISYYPIKEANTNQQDQTGLGCALFDCRLLEGYDFVKKPKDGDFVFGYIANYPHCFIRNVLDIKHLRE